MARPSRPPGFDMTYRPTETVFGPPFVVKIPSFIYLCCALAVVTIVLLAEASPAGSWLYVHITERGIRGPISARTVAILLMIGGVASVVRSNMRGVRIRGDGLEYRDVLALGFPKLRRFKWAQIDGIILDGPRTIALDLWDGTRAFLPEVSDRVGLSAVLEKVGHARAIPVRGGSGLDEIPDSSEFAEED